MSADAKPGRPLNYREYRQLIDRIRLVVAGAVPYGSTVLVVGKGDHELLTLAGRRAWHFPQTEAGIYSGHYPAGSAEATQHLEALRAKGADFLLFPSTALWWLDYYSEFRQHLESHYRLVVRQEDTCLIFALREPKTAQLQTASEVEKLRYHQLIRQVQAISQSILPPDATVLVVSKGDGALLGARAQHFPQAEDGGYAGYYPADSAAAIAHLEELRFKGADYLLFPATAFWWLDHYRGFRAHLKRHYRMVTKQKHCCLIFSLKATAKKDKAISPEAMLSQQSR